jgi:hypothetical protein
VTLAGITACPVQLTPLITTFSAVMSKLPVVQGTVVVVAWAGVDVKATNSAVIVAMLSAALLICDISLAPKMK